MKKRVLRPPSPAASAILKYGCFAIICYSVFLLLYHNLSLTGLYSLPLLTRPERHLALEHIWMSLTVLTIGAFLADRTEQKP